MGDHKTRSMDYTSRALLYKAKNFDIQAKFQLKIDGLPDNDIVEQHIGMALHNYCHANLSKLEALLKKADAQANDEMKKIFILLKTNQQAAQKALEALKKFTKDFKLQFEIDLKKIEAALPRVAEEIWKKQVAENIEYRDYKLKVGLIAIAKVTIAAAAAAGGIAASVVTGGTTAAITVAAIGAAISVTTGAVTALRDAAKSETTVRKNLEAAIEKLNNEIAKAKLRELTGSTKLQKVKEFFKSSPAKAVETLMDEHKKHLIGVRQKADAVHNGVLKLITAQDDVMKHIKDAKAKKQQVDPKLEHALQTLEKNVAIVLKSTESKLDAMTGAEKTHTAARTALNDAKGGNLDGVGKMEKALGVMGPFDFGDLASVLGTIGSVLAGAKV